MGLIKDATESIIKWVGVPGIVTIMVITVTVWSYYDISDEYSRLTAKESVGLFLFVLLVVAFIKTVYLLVKGVNQNNKTKDE
jgi:hypothetical protein